ncbi:MAG: AmmeMemoRadiSam system protein B [bacterium]
MKRLGVVIVIFLAIALAAHQAACKKAGDELAKGSPAPSDESVQEPVVAGQFYPASREELMALVDKDLAGAPRRQFDGDIMGLVVPHAGYQYSGQIAAAGFRQVEGRPYKRVVVIAISHHVPIYGAALSSKDAYRTPLGDIPIDAAAVNSILKKYPWASDDQKPYSTEHSLEVELPFLQRTLKDFVLVPVLVNTDDRAMLDKIALALDAEFPAGETLFVASTDLSHYHPYADATELDRKTIGLITDAKPDSYMEAVAAGKAELCGSSPVYILKKIAERRGAKFKLIQYANSGDTTGDRSRVVGYAAIAAVTPRAGGSLGDAQKKELLSLARTTLEAHVQGKQLPPLPTDAALKKQGAAFVTLKKKGHLRGCIGQIIARGPLDSTVQEMTVSAASHDPRFPPVRPDELKDIDIEISVLTAPEPLADPLAVRVGTDGLIIEKGFNRGVLLPQVPTEQGWNKEQFLQGLAEKAGLPPDGWKGARLMRFQAIVFGEK